MTMTVWAILALLAVVIVLMITGIIVWKVTSNEQIRRLYNIEKQLGKISRVLQDEDMDMRVMRSSRSMRSTRSAKYARAVETAEEPDKTTDILETAEEPDKTTDVLETAEEPDKTTDVLEVPAMQGEQDELEDQTVVESGDEDHSAEQLSLEVIPAEETVITELPEAELPETVILEAVQSGEPSQSQMNTGLQMGLSELQSVLKPEPAEEPLTVELSAEPEMTVDFPTLESLQEERTEGVLQEKTDIKLPEKMDAAEETERTADPFTIDITEIMSECFGELAESMKTDQEDAVKTDNIEVQSLNASKHNTGKSGKIYTEEELELLIKE